MKQFQLFKKTARLSLAFLLAIATGSIHAATNELTDTKAQVANKKTPDKHQDQDHNTLKVFGKIGKNYKTWSIGVHGGLLLPTTVLGGGKDFSDHKDQFGFGLSLRKQFGHAFGLQLNGLMGKLEGENKEGKPSNGTTSYQSFQTDLKGAVSINAVANVASIDMLRRRHAVNFFLSAGYGYAWHTPSVKPNGEAKYQHVKKNAELSSTKQTHANPFIPIGAGAKIKLSDALAFNLGYIMNFIDTRLLDGVASATGSNDRFSYGYGGLELTLGAKPNVDWINPVAVAYDDLKGGSSLEKEVQELKNRVDNTDQNMELLKRDADGDGVSDYFDKCLNTPSGVVVDGSGCELIIPEKSSTIETNNDHQDRESYGNITSGSDTGMGNTDLIPGSYSYKTIHFDFNSAVVATASYPALDKVAQDLRTNKKWTLVLHGYASIEGSKAYNQHLSEERARSVKAYLVNTGVDAKRIKVKGWGTRNPIADNNTEEGRAKNRRVVFETKKK